MRFFDRTEEIASLREIRRMSKDNAQFTVVTGRRRIGKTYLVWKAYEDEPILYFFVARKAEGDLCEDYRLEIESKLGIPTMGRAEHFADVFEFLMKLSTERPITLFIDEFQVERLQRLEVRFSLPVERRVLAVHKIIVKLESGGFYPGGEQLYAQPPRRGRLAGTGGAGEAEEPHLGARLDLRRGVAEQFRVQRFADHYHVP